MTTSTAQDDDGTCYEDSTSVWPTLLAAASTLLIGYFAGRVSFAVDVRKAMRRLEEASEPIEVSVRAF